MCMLIVASKYEPSDDKLSLTGRSHMSQATDEELSLIGRGEGFALKCSSCVTVRVTYDFRICFRIVDYSHWFYNWPRPYLVKFKVTQWRI